LATANLLQNKNVLYITLEMSEHKIVRRILANLFDVNINEIRNIEKTAFSNMFSTWRSKIRNNLIIKEYPPRTINANYIRTLIKELKLRKKFIPDIVYIDYIGRMLPTHSNKNNNTNTDCTILSEEVRAISMENDKLPIVSAWQSNREGFNQVEIDMTNTADSIGTASTADTMIAITQPPEFANLNKFCWMIIKNRDGLNNKKLSVCVDYFKMRVTDDQDNKNLQDMPPSSPDKQKESNISKAVEISNNLINKDNKDKFKKIIDFE
jgi:hypothetical protein